jgi:hypothetical protein
MKIRVRYTEEPITHGFTTHEDLIGKCACIMMLERVNISTYRYIRERSVVMEKEVYLLLGNIDQKLSGLCTDFKSFKDKATSEIGFTRCAIHREQVDNITRQVKWFRLVFGLGIGIPVLTILADKIVSWIK